MEAERMLHPVINQIGVDTQNEVVKEEKRLRYDNSPYGQIIPEVKKNIHKTSLSLDDCWFNGSRCKIRGTRLQQEILHPEQRRSCSGRL
jgi:hypothetical protein